MEVQLDSDVVGREFDRWLDWNGAADEVDRTNDEATTSLNRPSYPISPSSTAHSDSLLTNGHNTASSITGPLTPAHSFGSPEVPFDPSRRFSGDTLKEDEPLYRFPNLKRKLSREAPDMSARPPPAKAGASKRPHNVIEKRYRANLNEKIAELRDSVPALRAAQKAREREEGHISSGDDEADNLGQAGKLNKASILTKAVEYIKHLEFRNSRLEDENRTLKERLQTLDRVIAQGGHDAQRATAFTSENVIEKSSDEHTPSPSVKQESQSRPPQGLVPLPDDWKQLRQNQGQEHYGHVYQNAEQRSRRGSKWPARVMLGSMAGLMIMEGVAESDHGTESRAKGLFGIPLELLDGWTFLRSPRLYLGKFAEYCQAGGILPLVKGFLALTIFAFLIFSYLFNSKPHPERDQEKNDQGTLVPARPSSPIRVRRRAWSTSMQALRLPHHSFFPEWLAITSEWIKYTIQYCIGVQSYAWLTGRSIEDEIARIKAWDIALDAQLAGGDTEISRSRVVLTIYGAGTLPLTPMRLMQKALHCRVLLWNMGTPGTSIARLANRVATFFANRQWRKARLLHQRLSARDADRLPGYLNYLLQMDCDDVFRDIVTQRATNLMYDRPTSEFADDVLMDVVVEDHAIRSPLDAIAAWRSTCALHEALDAALLSPDSPDVLREHIQAALEIAPPDSAAETRALAVHTVLCPGRRDVFYAKAMAAMAPVTTQSAAAPYFIDSSTPTSARPEIMICLQYAKIMLVLDQDRDLHRVFDLLAHMSETIRSSSSTILSTALLYLVLRRIWRVSGSGHGPIECKATAMQLLDSFQNESSKMGTTDRRWVSAVVFLRAVWDLGSTSPSRRYSLVSNDTGYVSLSEGEHEAQIISPSPELRISGDLMEALRAL